MIDMLLQKPLSRPLLWLSGLLLLLAAIPHFGHINLLISGSFTGLIILRFLFWPTPDKPAPGWLLLILLPAALALVFYLANWTEGRQFGVALLVLMAGMKLLEMKTRRDLYIAVFMGYFILVTLFLFYQDPLITLYVFLVSTGLTGLLIATNLAEDALPWQLILKRSATMMLGSIPVMILLFVLFPRLDGPLWSLNLGGNSGLTGMSDNIHMGSISNLSQSREIAFRVRFRNDPPPAAQRYWRGMVLWYSDGRNWERDKTEKRIARFVPQSQPYDYEITMEASGQPWLFPLDHVLAAPQRLILNTYGELYSSRDIDTRHTYRLDSSLQIRYPARNNRQLRMGLQLPRDISPRTRQLAQKLRGQGRSDEQVIRAALQFFHEQPFVYTLQPPLLYNDPVDEFLFDTRKGFCEHYATSFVTLMRLAGIPARVIIGYQGGELNPIGGHLVVRQSDAHAWAEVWLEKRGWVRVDPTAAVAPDRIEHSIAPTPYSVGAPARFNLRNPPAFLSRLVRNLKWMGDNLQLNWHYWVVGFNSDRQQSLLQKMGLSRLRGYQLGIAAAMGAILTGSLVFLLGMRHRRHRQDPVRQAYTLFQRKLEKTGLNIDPATGPQDLLNIASAHCPEKSADIQVIMQQYMALRYGRHPRKDLISAFRKRVRKFRCS
ncbi:transglutaminase TgpA family protein [Thiolapillus sp.]